MAPSVNLGRTRLSLILRTDLPLGRIAEITENFSPAELSSIVNEAAIMAATKNADAVTQVSEDGGSEKERQRDDTAVGI
eukprot:748076-Hanusia_phi.AAC.2